MTFKGPKKVEYSEWWKPGTGMMYRRECLPGHHPQHPYNYILNTYNVNPEDYGVDKPEDYYPKCPECGK